MKKLSFIFCFMFLMACNESLDGLIPASGSNQNSNEGKGPSTSISQTDSDSNVSISPEAFQAAEEMLAKSQVKKIDLLMNQQVVDTQIPLSLCLDEEEDFYLQVTDANSAVEIVKNTYSGNPIQWILNGPEIIHFDETGRVRAVNLGMTYLIVLHPEFGRRYLVQVFDCNSEQASEDVEEPIVEENPGQAENPSENEPPQEETPELIGFRVSPDLFIVGETAGQSVTYLKVFSDGSEQPLTAEETSLIQFLSTNSSIGSLNAQGAVLGNQNGCAELTLNWQGFLSHAYISRGLDALIPKNDPFADRVVCFIPGPGAGFGQNQFPENILSGPKGKGANQGGFDVLALGTGGVIILETESPVQNGVGEDFIIFENAFQIGGNPNSIFTELAQVSVSENGEQFFHYDCANQDEEHFYPGCAGVGPVLANVDENNIDPTDPALAGGDAYDLTVLGLDSARFILIRDHQNGGGGGSAGFDLDAVSFRY